MFGFELEFDAHRVEAESEGRVKNVNPDECTISRIRSPPCRLRPGIMACGGVDLRVQIITITSGDVSES